MCFEDVAARNTNVMIEAIRVLTSRQGLPDRHSSEGSSSEAQPDDAGSKQITLEGSSQVMTTMNSCHQVTGRLTIAY